MLLLDTSASMQGDPISELNAGMVNFKEELMADNLAVKRVEVSVVSFGPVQVHNPFETADIFQPPVLVASGDTPMGAGIAEAMRLVEERKKTYTAAAVAYYRPWVFLITDGAPTDSWQWPATDYAPQSIRKSSRFLRSPSRGPIWCGLRRSVHASHSG